MSYCLVIWHFCSRVMEYNMEQLGKQALRFILNDFDKSYSELFAEAKKNTLQVLTQMS